MLKGFFKVIFIVAITAGAVAVGYKFLSIDTTILRGQEEATPPEPVLTMETLPDEQIGAPQTTITETQTVSEGERVRAFVVDYIVSNGARMLDSKTFPTKEQCTQTVSTVIGEYRRRGIPEQDIAETVAFPGSDGIVMLVTNGGLLYYVGCMTQQNSPWTTYVHYMPTDGQQ
jgi:hypothetical protein